MTEAIREYPQFNDPDGKVLNNGFIYIGEEHKDPKTRPIDVYWDEGLTVPAAQPLRTQNGYISRAGTPSKIWTAEAYSIGVYTWQNINVYTSLTGNGSLFGIEAKIDAIHADLTILVKYFDTVSDMATDASLAIGDSVETKEYANGTRGGNRYEIVAAGTGTHDGGSYIDLPGSQLQAKALWYSGNVNARQFGAVGDDAEDDTAALDNWLTYISSNEVTGTLEEGTYLCGVISNALAGDLYIRGDGEIKATGPNRLNMLLFTGCRYAIDIDGITINGNDIVARPFDMLNFDADASTLGSVYLREGLRVVNAKNNAPDTFTACAIRAQGGFSSVYFNGEIDGVDSSSTSGASTVGFWSDDWPGSGEDWVRKTVLGSSSRIKNVRNDNETLANADGIRVYAPVDKIAFFTCSPGAYFENCKGRSIKSQVMKNSIVGPVVLRNAYDGLNEIELQYAGGGVSNAQIHYDRFSANVVITSNQRSESMSTHSYFSNNDLSVVNDPTNINAFISIAVTDTSAENQGITIRDNKATGGSLKYFIVSRNADDVNVNRVVVDGNWAETIDAAFLRTHLFGPDARGQLSAVFTNNGCMDGCESASLASLNDLIVEYERNNFNMTSMLSSPFNVTIASGAVTVYGSTHRIDTEGLVPSDDLDTINFPGNSSWGPDQWLTLIANNDSRTIVLKDGTGNLSLNGDFSLASVNDRIVLSYYEHSSTWVEISRSSNAKSASVASNSDLIVEYERNNSNMISPETPHGGLTNG